MPRPAPQHTEAVNSDSFLDIVASVVSIMIIMVVMEGMRIKNTPVKLSIPASPEARELNETLAVEQSLRGDVAKAAAEIVGLQQQTALRAAERDALATMVSAAEHLTGEKQQQAEQIKQADIDIARQLADAQAELTRLSAHRQQAERAAAEPIVIESYPTPISRAVDGPEAHLLIDAGRVVVVPLEPLLEQFQSQAKRQVYKLMDQPELTDTVGPVDGFRLRYTLERRDVSPQMVKETGRGGSYARLVKWSLIPASNDIGEPVRLALDEGSEFRRAIKKILPGRTTVTIWVYPDGFEAFRQVRKELYRQGYAIAARPLPTGKPISGSPEGSKSAAQ